MELPPNISLQDLKASLPYLRRCYARADLTAYCSYIDPEASRFGGGYDAPHLRVIAQHLEQVESGACRRLFITCPPRHWKSSLCAEKFVGWYLGKHPTHTVMLVSFETGLTTEFSIKVRDTVAGNTAYQELFPDAAVRADMCAAEEWALTKAYRATVRVFGVGSAIRGRGADLIIIDDPMEDKAEHSKEHREKVVKWYKNTLRPRLEPGGAIVLIMSRAHKQDLAGVLMEESRNGDGEKWVQVHLKAIAEKDDSLGRSPGTALWPGRWPLDELLSTKKSIGSRSFAAQYQGEPRADDTAILDSSKLRMVDFADIPKRFVKVVRCWDLAFSDKSGADYVAGVKMGLMEDGRRYILHVKRIHGRWTKSKPEIIKLAQEDGPFVTCAIEANGTQLGYAQDIQDDIRMSSRTTYEYVPEGNKEMRASIWGGRLEDGIVYCVRAPWNQELFDEMDYFGSTDHDDIVDGVSGAWAVLGRDVGPHSRVKAKKNDEAKEETGRPDKHFSGTAGRNRGIGV